MVGITRAVTQVLTALLLFVSLTAVWVPAFSPIAGSLTAVAFCTVLFHVPSRTRRVCMVLLVLAAMCYALYWATGGRLSVSVLVVSLLANSNHMLVGFLLVMALASMVLTGFGASPGRSTTMSRQFVPLVVHSMCAILNIGGVQLFSKFQESRSPDLDLASDIMLGFSTVAYWSPFWVGFAVVADLAPDVNMMSLVPLGAGFAAILLVLRALVRPAGGAHVDPHVTLPAFNARLIAVPLAVAVATLVTHRLFPSVPVVAIVMISTSLSSAVSVAGRTGRQWLRSQSRKFADEAFDVWRIGVVFVAAGVFESGLRLLPLHVSEISRLVVGNDIVLLWIGIVGVIFLGVLGVHPVVSIVVFGSVSIGAGVDHELFALSALIAWGMSLAVNPISGISIVVRSGFRVRGVLLLRRMVKVSTLSAVLACPFLYISQLILN